MGLGAPDTADNGLNQVTGAYVVPAGCVPPPGPPSVSLVTTNATATEASNVAGAVTIRRDAVSSRALTVSLFIGGSAAAGSRLRRGAGICHHSRRRRRGRRSRLFRSTTPLVENNETVTLTLRAAAGTTSGRRLCVDHDRQRRPRSRSHGHGAHGTNEGRRRDQHPGDRHPSRIRAQGRPPVRKRPSCSRAMRCWTARTPSSAPGRSMSWAWDSSRRRRLQ